MRPTYDKKMNQQVIEAIYDGRFLDFLQERGIEFSKQELIVIISELYKAYDTTASMVIDKNIKEEIFKEMLINLETYLDDGT